MQGNLSRKRADYPLPVRCRLSAAKKSAADLSGVAHTTGGADQRLVVDTAAPALELLLALARKTTSLSLLPSMAA